MESAILLLSFLAAAAWGYFCMVKVEAFMKGTEFKEADSRCQEVTDGTGKGKCGTAADGSKPG